MLSIHAVFNKSLMYSIYCIARKRDNRKGDREQESQNLSAICEDDLQFFPFFQFNGINTTKNTEEYDQLKAQMMDLLSDVETIEQLKETFAKDSVELSDGEAERMFEKLKHARQIKKVPLNLEELSLVSDGLENTADDSEEIDGWVGDGIYRYNKRLYCRGQGFYIRALDGCASTEDGWCWVNDSCNAQWNIYDYEYGISSGDDRTDIDPARMNAAFINGEISGGEEF